MSLLFAGHILTNIASPDNVPQNPLYWALHPVLGGPDMIELPGGAEVAAATDEAHVRYWIALDNGSLFEAPLAVVSLDHSAIEGDGFGAALLRAIIGSAAPSVLAAPVNPTYELPVYHAAPPQEMPAQWATFLSPGPGEPVMGPLPADDVHLVGVQEDMGAYGY